MLCVFAVTIAGTTSTAFSQDKRVRDILVVAFTEVDRAVAILNKCFQGSKERDELSEAVKQINAIIDNALGEGEWSEADLDIIQDHRALATKEQLLDYSCSTDLADALVARGHVQAAAKGLIAGMRGFIDDAEKELLE